MSTTLNISDFEKRTANFLKAVTAELPKINEKVAAGALAIIIQRITDEGVGSNGAALGKYSDAQVPFFYYKNGKLLAPYSNSDAFSKGAADRVQAAKKKGKKSLSYKEWREFNNLQTNHIDLKFTGAMWDDIGVVSNELKGETAVTVVSALNTKNRGKGLTTDDVMFFNAERYGDFMSLSPDEEQQIAEAFDAELQILINETFEK